MNTTDSAFVHLHVHTDFSLLDGAASCMQLANKARSLGMKHLAITDHGNMFGALKFRDACLFNKDHEPLPEAERVHPVIGCEFYMSETDRHERSSLKRSVDETNEGADGKPFHLILLAETSEGYHNLMTLSSLAYIEGFYGKPRIDSELLEKYHTGLICLSACIAGEIPRLILKGKKAEAEKRALYFKNLFGAENFFLEIQDHGIKAQKDSNPHIIEIAKKNNIPLVLTNDIHYLNKEDDAVQDILICIGTQKKRSDEKRMKFSSNQFYFKSAQEMAALFPEYPEAMSNTVKIAERCKAEIPFVPTKELVNYLPKFDVPHPFTSMDEYIRTQTIDGLKKRYGAITPEIQNRAEYELNIIISMGFTGYFLIVADFINWAKSRGIPVGPGRGSGTGSVVAYALRITDIDPFKYNLLFERFLNPERISMPDFDIDFCQDRRGEVIEYVTQKYGKEHVGQIITFGTLKAKNAIKDVARVLDISIDESNMITKLIPDGVKIIVNGKEEKITLENVLKIEPKLRELESNPKYTELFTMAKKLEGKNRNPGLHAAGIVISKKPLINYVPLYYDNKSGSIATQWTMDLIESCGLVKMDFLGLATLTVIKNACDIIRRRGGEYANFNIETIPEDDAETFRLFSEGRTASIFQFESDGMQNYLKQLKPGRMDDLIAMNALYRPGPMDNIPQYIKSKNSEMAIKYPDPCLKEYLEETYGVIVYQEQVMQVAQRIAGYTLGGADVLRRAMGKKKAEVMKKEKGKFIEGALKNGFSEAKASEIFDILEKFAGYGFNKGHAAAYSVLAYQTAYLKAHFPHEFMAASLTNVLNSPDKLAKYIDEVRGMGIEITPPDINKSEKLFTAYDGRIVYGFLGIKGVGEGPAEAIIAGRENGPYTDFMNFLERVDIKALGKKVVELLIKTGAFDSFGVSRAVLAGNLEKAVEYAQRKKDDKEGGQESLFGAANVEEYTSFKFSKYSDWTREEKLQMEKDLIGFYFSGQPLDEYKEIWTKITKLNLSAGESGADAGINGKTYTLIGQIHDKKQIISKSGQQMGFASLSDYNGQIDITFFASVWQRCEKLLADNKIVCIKGKYDNKRGKPGILADEVFLPDDFGNIEDPLDQYEALWKKHVRVNLAETEKIYETDEHILLGEITSLREMQARNGKNAGEWMAFATLRDFNGEVDLTFFSTVWEKYKLKIDEKKVVALKGRINRYNGKTSFKVSRVLSMDRLEREIEAEPETAPAAISTALPPEDNDAGYDPPSWHGIVSTAEPKTEYRASIAAGVSAINAMSREVHIRLRNGIAGMETSLLALRDALSGYAGACVVFIHIPQESRAETVVRSVALRSSAAAADKLRALAAVADVWCR
ncbi:MAG: DNA polymerase III subunit alpha [Spirochaetaceae bacterium]|jgi:DNA polymerase-3 subunit alpha|nr:DNA polymerase III subunit alpha [Spirochaetaceae bacterium]